MERIKISYRHPHIWNVEFPDLHKICDEFIRSPPAEIHIAKTIPSGYGTEHFLVAPFTLHCVGDNAEHAYDAQNDENPHSYLLGYPILDMRHQRPQSNEDQQDGCDIWHRIENKS